MFLLGKKYVVFVVYSLSFLCLLLSQEKTITFIIQTEKDSPTNTNELKLTKAGPVPHIYTIKTNTHNLLEMERTLHLSNIKYKWLDILPKDGLASLEGPVGQKVQPPSFNDPLFPYQWNLYNREIPGNDLNIVPVWNKGFFGKGAVVCIIDNGIEFTHPDLRKNFRPDLSTNLLAPGSSILPINQTKTHGTRCAGQVVAEMNNGICGVGIAPEASLSGVLLLGDEGNDDAKNNAALLYKNQENQIYSCSWGPRDSGTVVMKLSESAVKTFIEGIVEGRQGRGSLFLFPVGNGGRWDNCNYDGYISSIFTLATGAIDSQNNIPIYMEECSTQLAVSYSNSFEKGVPSTTVNGGCTLNHGGTSATSPLLAGIIAIALALRPELLWRDFQHLLVETAVPFHLEHQSWQRTGAGRYFSNFFGFGKLDASLFINRSLVWKHVGPLLPKPLKANTHKQSLSYSEKPSCFISKVENWMVQDLLVLEHVMVTFTLEYTKRSSVEISLCSPSGTKVCLLSPRKRDKTSVTLKDFSISATAFWGEKLVGDWTLCFWNKEKEETGILHNWRLVFWGETTKSRLEKYTKSLPYKKLLLFPYYPPTPDFFNSFNDLYHLEHQTKEQ